MAFEFKDGDNKWKLRHGDMVFFKWSPTQNKAGTVVKINFNTLILETGGKKAFKVMVRRKSIIGAHQAPQNKVPAVDSNSLISSEKNGI